MKYCKGYGDTCVPLGFMSLDSVLFKWLGRSHHTLSNQSSCAKTQTFHTSSQMQTSAHFRWRRNLFLIYCKEKTNTPPNTFKCRIAVWKVLYLHGKCDEQKEVDHEVGKQGYSDRGLKKCLEHLSCFCWIQRLLRLVVSSLQRWIDFPCNSAYAQSRVQCHQWPISNPHLCYNSLPYSPN